MEAIETLQQIISMFLPIEKLTIIRNTVEKMTPVAQDLLGDNYIWNMDDLFPLFLYVVVRARIPHLGAELEFMENFMDRNLENGELGIMFTTLKVPYENIPVEDFYINLYSFLGLLSTNTPRQIIYFLKRYCDRIYSFF